MQSSHDSKTCSIPSPGSAARKRLRTLPAQHTFEFERPLHWIPFSTHRLADELLRPALDARVFRRWHTRRGALVWCPGGTFAHTSVRDRKPTQIVGRGGHHFLG